MMPDASDWGTPAAHAQTPSSADNLPTDTVQARADFLNYLSEKRAEIQSALSGNDPGLALYRLGYVLHAIQALAVHQGITNAEHSYETYDLHVDPDKNPEGLELAKQCTGDFLASAK